MGEIVSWDFPWGSECSPGPPRHKRQPRVPLVFSLRQVLWRCSEDALKNNKIHLFSFLLQSLIPPWGSQEACAACLLKNWFLLSCRCVVWQSQGQGHRAGRTSEKTESEDGAGSKFLVIFFLFPSLWKLFLLAGSDTVDAKKTSKDFRIYA